METVTFRTYSNADKRDCLSIFDANCPEYFSPGEREGFLEFLDSCPPEYQLCVVADEVMGAFGVLDRHEKGKDLRWILLNPEAQGLGIGSLIMARATKLARSAGAEVVHIGASHKSAPFFARFGAREITVLEHGWGPEMHRVDMELHL